MKRRLFVALMLWLGIMGAYFVVLRGLFPFPMNVVTAGLCGTFFTILIGAIAGWLNVHRESRLIQDALCEKPIQHGSRIAVVGKLAGNGPALRAPASNRECLIYEYEISHMEIRTGRNPTKQKIVDLSGVGMNSCVVDGLRGSVRLIGFPILDEFETMDWNEEKETIFQRLQAYLKVHPPKQFIGVEKFGFFDEMAEVYANEDGVLQVAWQTTDHPLDAKKQTIVEKTVEAGQSVVAFGYYDASQHALTGRKGFHDRTNKLCPGTSEKVLYNLFRLANGRLLFAFILFLGSHLMLGFFLWAAVYHNSRSVIL